MHKNLQKAQALIKNIQKNADDSQKIQNYCQELEDLVQYLDPTTSYHYQLFLIQMYTIKLGDFASAKVLCKKLTQDKRNVVQIQGWLRYSFVNACQHNFREAIKNLQKAKQLQSNKLQQSIVLTNYFQRLLNHSKDKNLLLGLNHCVTHGQYDTAMKYFNEELEDPEDINLLQNKFYAAKFMKSLFTSIYPNNFKKSYKAKYEQFLSSVEQQLQDQGAQMLENNYLQQKKYYDKIIELYNGCHTNIESKQKSGTNKKLVCDVKMKKILAMLKLERVINLKKVKNNVVSGNFANGNIVDEFQKCLKEMKEGKINNYNMINDFVNQEAKLIVRANFIYYKCIFNKFIKNLSGGSFSEAMSPNKSKNKLKFKRQTLYGYNSYKNLPSFDGTNSGIYKTKQESSPKLGIQMHECQSQDYESNKEEEYKNFIGSQLIKINQNSQGHQKRYFYISKKQYQKGKFKLYYNARKDKANTENDNYYDFRKYSKLEQGKKSKALQRKQCDKFQQKLCFSVTMSDGSHKNFCVVEPNDYPKWIYMFQKFKDLKQGKSEIQIMVPSQSQFSAKKMTKQPQNNLSKTNMMKSRKTVNFD